MIFFQNFNSFGQRVTNYGTYSGTAGDNNSNFGYSSGRRTSQVSIGNAFFGSYSANMTTSGHDNSFFGSASGQSNVTGSLNTFIGRGRGYVNVSGNGNVFLGYYSGFHEKGSNKLYIDNSSTSSPLIWGDFSLNALKFNGSVQVTGNFTTKSGAYLDDDTSHGGNNDDWMRFNGYIEMRSTTDNYGIVLRNKDATDYFGITQVNGASFLADTQVMEVIF